jgi:hypothetical protein
LRFRPAKVSAFLELLTEQEKGRAEQGLIRQTRERPAAKPQRKRR